MSLAVAPAAPDDTAWPPPSGAAPTDHSPPTSVGLVRIRIGLLYMAYVVVGATACGIFDRVEPALILAPTVPTLAAFVLANRSGPTRVMAAIAAILVTGVATVLANGGDVDDIVDAFSSGYQALLSTEWPSPDRPDLIGSVAIAIAAATAISAELAARRRFHLLPLVPLTVAYIGVVALSAPLGVNWLSLGATAVLCVGFALFRNEGSLHDRLVFLSGERRLIPLLAIVVGIGTALTVPIVLSDRADPRRTEPPRQSAPLLDPIEAARALRNLDPAVELHRITSLDGEPLPDRWRTTALQAYDGARWTPALTLRPIGRTLGPVTGATVDADISFLDDDLALVPLSGPPVTVDAAVETDADRTVVRLIERPVVGEVVRLVANRSPTSADAANASAVGRLVGDDVSSLSDLARAMAGDGSPLDQVMRLETTMREEDFVLDDDAPGGGLQRAFIEIFLRDTKRGNAEQFVTGFVLLARSLGVEARVATGFVVESGTPTGALSLASSDATVWPEVQLSDGTWLALDPVPDDEATDNAPPPPEPQTQTPAAPQPPVPPPPDAEDENTPVDEPDEDTGAGLSAVIAWVLRGGAFLAGIVLPFVVAAALILGLKYRRRSRRLSAPEATQRIRGAWASATDALVDAGLTISRSDTDSEIAAAGDPIVADAGRELHRLASLSSAATFGTLTQQDLLAEDATRCLDAVETSMLAGRTRRQRMRWLLSTRSLRSRTRSPVTD